MPADKRQADLAIPYVHTPQAKQSPASPMSSALPVAAMFMRSRVLAWCALFSSLQNFLNEPANLPAESTPTWVGLVTAVVGLGMSYMDFVMGRPGPRPQASTDADAAASLASETLATVAQAAAETLHKLKN